MPTAPFVVGQWVRDQKFYGRRAILGELLDGPRHCVWLLGTRRIGKTSVLKQLEHLALAEPQRRLFPLFWDFQGSEGIDDLHQSFEDALIDALDRLGALGITLGQLRGDDLLATLANLRRELKARELTLLLLGDEVEELVSIYEQDPRFLRRLRRALLSPENIRTVFASTIRLWKLAAEGATTSPFLAGFTPPLPLRGLADEEARALICQTQLPQEVRPRFAEATVEAIRSRCHNHPYLLQLLSERTLELGDLARATEALANDPMARFFFGTDLAMLSELERRILSVLEGRAEATAEVIADQIELGSGSLQGSLARLELLGFVARSNAGGFAIPNPFFQRWLGDLAREAAASAPSGRPRSGSRPPNDETVARTETLRRIEGRYQLLQRVGKGSSGEVFKAHDALLDTVVALKILRPEVALDAEGLERLRREVVLSRDLSHPNILKVYHLGEDQGQRYITMQYVEGTDLGKVIAKEAPLATARSLTIAAKLAGALGALHRCSLLHRDIKPANVLIGRDGEPRISDFGLARRRLDPSLTQEGMFIGTPRYASPEQVTGEELDERSDLYSLGVVLFEMVTGRTPFDAPSLPELLSLRLRVKPPAPSALEPAVPTALSDLILRCLALDRTERVQSADELGAALAALRVG